MLNTKHIRRRFELAADNFDGADFVHTETRQGLMSRLEPLLIDADIVVDLGAATGSAARALEKRFRGAKIVAVDIAHRMLRVGRKKTSWLSKTGFTQARAEHLPFADESIDVVFSNMLLPWISDPQAVFKEIARVLKKGGVFAFATLGPDSLQEIGRAWLQVDKRRHINRFLDMHDLGDGLVNANLRDPVLDVERLAVSYGSSEKLFADLSAAGARNSLLDRQSGLTGKTRFGKMAAALEGSAVDGNIVLDLELVFGHCWGAGPKNDPSNFRIDAGEIPLRRNR